RLVELTSSSYPMLAVQKSLATQVPSWASTKNSMPPCAAIDVAPQPSIPALENAATAHPAIRAVDADMNRFLGTPQQEGLIPKLNNLNGRIAFLEQVVDIVQTTRREAQRMRMEFPQ